MGARHGAGNAVRLAGIEKEVKLLSRLDESVNHLDGVLHVHVVIAGAMYFKEMAVQMFSKIYRRTLFVCGFVSGHKSAVAFSVNRVVIMPVTDRRNRQPGLEAV